MDTKFAIAVMVITAGFSACGGKNTSAPKTPAVVKPAVPEDKGWAFETTPYFADEFNTDGAPNSNNWGYDTGGGGFGNHELEYYTKTNAAAKGGEMVITARKEDMGGMSYTSTRMVSKNVGSMKYGRVEVKVKLPTGRGTWPAIWMLPDTDVYGKWPNSGEIDIMEMVGFDPGNVHFTVHNQSFFAANGKGDSKMIATASSDYHVYRLDWTPYAIRGFYDDALVFTYVNTGGGSSVYPYDQNFHLLMNVAIGGDWGGQKGVDDSALPTTMNIDYVRFYKMIDK